MHNHSYENEFNLHVNEISFSYGNMGTKTRFEEEAKGNSEMAYLQQIKTRTVKIASNCWPLRLPHTSRFFVAELQIFCRGQIGLKFVGPSACRTLADFLSQLTALRSIARSLR